MKRNMTTILLFVVLFVGLALLLYPSVSDFYNSFHQSRAVATYNTAVEQESKKDYEADWAAANAYNEKLRAQSTVDRLIMTDEEREEYEPHIDNGFIIYSGVDYEQIIRQAEKEADIILWDGGNNDTPFFRPTAHIVVFDPHRAGHELRYHPGETNLRLCDIAVVNKVDSADPDAVKTVRHNIRTYNPAARIVLAASPLTITARA